MEKIVFICLFLATTLFGKSYVDLIGRNVEVKKSSRLVFIGPGALRLGVYLGLENRLVGIENIENQSSKLSPYRTFLGKEFISKLPTIGQGGPGKIPNLEALLVTNPDVIVASFVDKNQLEIISSKTKIPVIAVSYGASYGGNNKKNLEDIKTSLALLGEITGTQQRAKKLIEFIKTQEDRLSKTTLKSQTVYIGGVGYKGAQGITSTDANYPPFELLGLKNAVFKNSRAQGHQFIELETLLKTDPQIIFTDMLGKIKIQEEYVQKKEIFNTLSAYKNGNIKELLGFNFYTTNIENLFVIAWQIASAMGFEVDLDRASKEIFDAFYPEKGSELLGKLSYGFNKQ
ncbi:MAG: ABC transporter substrate-binding protein [Sulfurospirillaceae bacterium]|nr:ABC transporter substrate-binding protein [Sulfurospirillaceae bacterium]MDD3462102.1 ABC transporter substrate-binding protein [Sulfurospirillaceae bacterium]